MNRKEAIKLDKSFYAEQDQETGLYCVFGSESEFAYYSYASNCEANLKASDMNKEWVNYNVLRHL